MVNQAQILALDAQTDSAKALPKADNATTARISLNSGAPARVLTGLAFLVLLASCAVLLLDYATGYSSVAVHKLVKLFYVDLELNVPAFFSTLLLLSASLLLAIIAVSKRTEKDSYVWHWAFLSIGFLLMSFDETVAVHERLIEPMRAILGEQNLGVLYFAWVVPASALVLFLAIFFLKFLWNLPAKTRISFIIAAALYLGAALGMELIEGKHSEIYGKDNLPYIILTTIEETLEMAGVIVFIRALLNYISDNFKALELRFDDFAGRQ